MDALKEAMDLGLTSAVGVSNYSKDQMEEAHAILAASGIPLASNQIKYSLLDRKAEKDGLVQSGKDLDIAIVAYRCVSPLPPPLPSVGPSSHRPSLSSRLSHSPLEGGKLTSGGTCKDPRNEKLAELLKLMEFVGVVNGGKSVSQVALNYIVTKGLLPIPAAKTEAQAREHAGAMGWSMDDNEVSLLEEKLEYLGL